LLFHAALVFLVKRWIGNGGLAFIVFLLAEGVLYGLATKQFYLADLFAIEIPNVFSEITFGEDAAFYLQQRFYLFLLGAGLCCFAVRGFWRLPNATRESRRGSYAGVVLFILAGMLAGCLVRESFQTRKVREAYKRHYLTQEQASVPNVHVASHEIKFDQTPRGIIQASSRLTVNNPHRETLSRVLLYLNPGLRVTALSVNQRPVKFTREGQLLSFPYRLQPGASARLELLYEGEIDERVCYPEISPETYKSRYYLPSFWPYRFERHYAYTGKNYTLLTPECLWYPVAVPPVTLLSPYNRERQFTRYTLTVKNESVKRVVSQGIGKQAGNDVVFRSPHAYAGLSLNIGDYRGQSVKRGASVYSARYYPDHNRVARFSCKEDFEYTLRRIREASPYQPDRLTFVEVPLSFRVFPREGRMDSELTQSEVVFLAERWIDNIFSRIGEIQRKENAHNGIISTAITRLLIPFPDYPERTLYGLFADDMFFISDPRYPGLNQFLNDLQKEKARGISNATIWWWGYDTTLFNYSLAEFLQTFKGDQKVFRSFVQTKQAELKDRLFASGDAKKIQAFIVDYFDRHRYRQMYVNDFLEAFQRELQINMRELLDDIYHEKRFPLYQVKDFQAFYKLEGLKRSFYAASVKIRNASKWDGVIKFVYALPFTWTPGQGVPPLRQAEVKYLFLKAGECKEFRFALPGVGNSISLECSGPARNMPQNFVPKHVLVNEPDAQITPGEFTIDAKEFEKVIPPGTFIVDNRDKGFRYMEGTKKKKLLDTKEEPRWQFPTSENFYGDSVRDAALHVAGNKGARAEWHVVLPESGRYKVFVYNPDILQHISYQKRISRKELAQVTTHRLSEYVQTYTLFHEAGEEILTLDLKQAQKGWNELGTFNFTQGNNKLVLHDKHVDPKFYVIADAVKWVKVE